MSAPVANGSGPAVDVGTLTDPAADSGLTNALGNAALQCARQGAGANDAAQAKDFGAAALAFVQALMAIVAPKTAQPPGQGGGGSQGAPTRPTAPS